MKYLIEFAYETNNQLVFLLIALVVVCLYSCILMFIKASRVKSNASYMYYAFLCLIWAVFEVSPLILPDSLARNWQDHSALAYLVAAATLSDFSLLFPLVTIHHSFVKSRNLFFFLLPTCLMLLVYGLCFAFNVSALKGVQKATLQWVLIAYVLIRTVQVIYSMRRFFPVYEHYLGENYSDGQRSSVRWLHFLSNPVAFVLIMFLFYVLTPSVRAAEIYLLFLMLAFVYFTARMLLFEEIEISAQYRLVCHGYGLWWELQDVNQGSIDPSPIPSERLKEMCAQLEAWMQQDKPYCSDTFRAADVRNKMHWDANESASFFSAAYHCNFYTWVSEYRITEAKRLIANCEQMQLKEVAFAVGFTSQSVFARAFAQQTGMTAVQYRQSLINK